MGEIMRQLLCYGDSNTWGLIPGTNQRFDWETRWTGILQKKLNRRNIRVIEEGLCGRTTVFDDVYREHRNGLKTLPLVMETNANIDYAILMLGTNDCKAHYKTNPYRIGLGLEQCLDKLKETVSAENILVVSPIHLGEEVWRNEYDPEFDRESVEVSKGLCDEYKKIAARKGVNFLAASDYASPSKTDQEHMDEAGHKAFAEAVYAAIRPLI